MAYITKAMLLEENKSLTRVIQLQHDEIERLKGMITLHEKYGQHAQNSTALMTIQETARAVSNIFQALPTAERIEKRR